MSEGDDLNCVKTDVELLKKDMDNVQNLLSKLDTAIDKIADVSNGISKILAVHDQSIQNIRSEVTERKRVAEKESELLHKRISDMKEEQISLREKHHKEVMEALHSLDKKYTDQLSKTHERIHVLDRWRYWILGIGAAVGFIAAQLIWLVPVLENFLNKKP